MREYIEIKLPKTIGEVAIEGMFYAHNPKTVIKLAQFRGALSLKIYRDWETDRKSTRLNSSHRSLSRMPSSA